MEVINNDSKPKTGGTNVFFTISLILFILVSVLSGMLWTMQNKLQKDIQISNDKITDFNNQIETLKKDNDIAAYDIVISTEAEINKSIDESQAQKYITETIELGKKYKLLFSGFTYNGDSVTTIASTNNRDAVTTDSIIIVSNFIKDFRTIGHPIFRLDPITSIVGDSIKRTFNTTFKIAKK